jgi:hypothetical protein
MTTRPFAPYQNTRLWAAVEAMITELTSTGEIAVNTAPGYVVGYLCRELLAKKLVVEDGGE